MQKSAFHYHSMNYRLSINSKDFSAPSIPPRAFNFSSMAATDRITPPQPRSSIIHLLARLGQLALGPLRVAGRRVQVLMAEDLGEADQIVAVVVKELMSHRVPEQMRMQLHADEGRILVAQCPDASLGQGPPFADEQAAGLTGGRVSR